VCFLRCFISRRIRDSNETYKNEVLQSINSSDISIYHIGNEWWDLCAGPHVDTTGAINIDALELQSVAGAYWKGDEKSPMLQVVSLSSIALSERLKMFFL
jgi:threonyl-tRNA synthetase